MPEAKHFPFYSEKLLTGSAKWADGLCAVDRDRAEARKLKRKLAKEQRSAVRELRKDAVFLGDEVDKERDAQDQERKNTLRKNTAWLQRQEADFKSGGQGGLWKKHKRR